MKYVNLIVIILLILISNLLAGYKYVLSGNADTQYNVWVEVDGVDTCFPQVNPGVDAIGYGTSPLAPFATMVYALGNSLIYDTIIVFNAVSDSYYINNGSYGNKNYSIYSNYATFYGRFDGYYGSIQGVRIGGDIGDKSFNIGYRVSGRSIPLYFNYNYVDVVANNSNIVFGTSGSNVKTFVKNNFICLTNNSTSSYFLSVDGNGNYTLEWSSNVILNKYKRNTTFFYAPSNIFITKLNDFRFYRNIIINVGFNKFVSEEGQGHVYFNNFYRYCNVFYNCIGTSWQSYVDRWEGDTVNPQLEYYNGKTFPFNRNYPAETGFDDEGLSFWLTYYPFENNEVITYLIQSLKLRNNDVRAKIINRMIKVRGLDKVADILYKAGIDTMSGILNSNEVELDNKAKVISDTMFSYDTQYLILINDNFSDTICNILLYQNANYRDSNYVIPRLLYHAPLTKQRFNGTDTENIDIEFRWDNIKGANATKIQIANDEVFSNILVDTDLPMNSNKYNYRFNQNGTYYWRIKGMKK